MMDGVGPCCLIALAVVSGAGVFFVAFGLRRVACLWDAARPLPEAVNLSAPGRDVPEATA